MKKNKYRYLDEMSDTKIESKECTSCGENILPCAHSCYVCSNCGESSSGLVGYCLGCLFDGTDYIREYSFDEVVRLTIDTVSIAKKHAQEHRLPLKCTCRTLRLLFKIYKKAFEDEVTWISQIQKIKIEQDKILAEQNKILAELKNDRIENQRMKIEQDKILAKLTDIVEKSV